MFVAWQIKKSNERNNKKILYLFHSMRINPMNGIKKASPMNITKKKIIEIKHLNVDGQIKAIRYTHALAQSLTHTPKNAHPLHRIQYA